MHLSTLSENQVFNTFKLLQVKIKYIRYGAPS